MNKRNQQGSGLVVLIVILSLAIVGTLGYIFWDKYVNQPADTPTTSNNETPAAEEPKAKCADGDDEKATSGVFCSEEIGIKFMVPTIFKGDLKVAGNYAVTKDFDQKPAGKSEKVFQVKMSGNDKFTFTIAREALRSGYTGVGYKLQNAYYDAHSAKLGLVGSDQKISEQVPSFKVGSTKVYKGTEGDAGVTGADYLAIVNRKIVIISIRNFGYIGPEEQDPTTIDAEKVFKELDTAVHAITIL